MTESGMEFDDTWLGFFRFQDCPGHQQLSHLGFKESDIGWYLKASEILFIAELKDYRASMLRQGKLKSTINELALKTEHVLEMIAAALIGRPFGRDKIRPCLPQAFEATATIKIIHIIKCLPEQEPVIVGLNDKFETHNRIPSRKLLYDIAEIKIITERQAQKLNHIIPIL